MDFDKLFQDPFAQSVLIAAITTAAPLVFTYLMEHFGWRASLSRDAKLYEELRKTAGDDASEDETEVMHVVRAKVFERARSHMIDQSKGLRTMARIIRVGLFALYALTVSMLVLGILGHKVLADTLAMCGMVLLTALIILGVVFIPWLVYDQSERSKAKKVLDDGKNSDLLFTDESKLIIKKHR